MITAEEARKQTTEKVKSNQLEEIERKIKAAINYGDFSITVDYLYPVTQAALEELGYEVRHYECSYQTDKKWEIFW